MTTHATAADSSSRNTPRLPMGLTVERRFTVAGQSPFAAFTFVKREAVVRDFKTGEVKFQLAIEVPDDWEQGAVDVVASKYARKAGVPQYDDDGNQLFDDDGNPVLGPERSAKQIIGRMARAWRIWGERGGYFATADDAQAFEDEMAYMIMNQMGAPNSPQWFNTGLFEAYGIVEDAEGNCYYDPDRGEVVYSTHKYERSAVNACYIVGVEDNLAGPDGIMALATNEARLFKSGSGSGANLGKVREKGAPLTAGGQSSGVMGFARALDRTAGAIKSGGTTRRAAKMVILDADHPDIEEFVQCKVVEEKIARDLISLGYDSGYDTPGGAYDIVSFQNANHSVRIPRGFMALVESNGELELRSRRDGSVVGTIPAAKLWQEIAEAAWFCADPGVQFDGIINDWATTPNDGKIRGSNPCSEYLHVDNTACNLASINLAKFFDTDRQRFDIAGFEHAARLWTIALEISVSMSHYPTESVARNSYEHRTLGLGYANLGALVMRAGLAYDSREARAVMGAVTSLMNSRAYATSAEMAAAVGPCAAYVRNAEAMQRVLRNHRRAAYGTERADADLGDYEQLEVLPVEIDHRILARTPFGELTDAVKRAADDMVQEIARNGARNTQTTCIAPTGTIGLAMSCDTTGPEPDFALVKWKKLAGGGYMKIVNSSVPAALRALGYTEAQIDRIVTYALGTQTLDSNCPVNRQSLLAAGVPAAVLAKVEAELPTSGNIAMAFAPHVVGRDLYMSHGLDPDVDQASMLLTALGFSADQVVSSSKTICGHETVEGAPDLREADLPVFDTANYCGDGTRFIAWEGHVAALGAIQPHVSGGISKTINMPHEATVDDIRRAHELAFELGVKCVAVYRDGSKASQPLSRSIVDDADGDDNADDAVSQLSLHGEIAPGMSPVEYYRGQVPPRFRLPKNRAARTFSFEIGGMDVYLTTGEYDDGTLGEIWVNVGKDGSTMHGAFSAFSIAVSLGLQRGVPLEHFVEKFMDRNFSPNGIVVHPNLKMAKSIPDAIFRLLGWWYLGRDELVQVPGGGPLRREGVTVTPPAAPVLPAASKAADAAPKPDVREQPDPASGTLASPYTGNLCPECHSPEMVKNGTCERCLSCGATTGCS